MSRQSKSRQEWKHFFLKSACCCPDTASFLETPCLCTSLFCPPKMCQSTAPTTLPSISVWGPGLRVEKPWAWASAGPLFFQYFRQSRETHGHAFSGPLLGGNIIKSTISSNHCLCAGPAHMAESGPLALLQVLQNSGNRIFMSRIKFPVGARSLLTKFERKTNS